MTARQLIAAFLSLLLLAGGPGVSALPELGGHPDAAVADTAGCGGLAHENAEAGTATTMDCYEPEPQHCVASAPQCSSVSVYALVADVLRAPVQHHEQYMAVPVRTAHQNPIPEVLTPPPDFLS